MGGLVYALGGILMGAALFWVRTRYFNAEPAIETPLGRAALGLGLQPRGRKRFVGTVNGARLTIEAITASDGTPGVLMWAAFDPVFPGEVRLSGPSDNAGSDQPETKLRVGHGLFDFHFWLIKSEPKPAAGALLMPLDAVREQMLAAPFGRWTFVGRAASYQSYRIPPTVYADKLPVLANILTTIVTTHTAEIITEL